MKIFNILYRTYIHLYEHWPLEIYNNKKVKIEEQKSEVHNILMLLGKNLRVF